MDSSTLHSLLFLLFTFLSYVIAGMDSCYDEEGIPSRCLPKFENAAFSHTVIVSNVCGIPPEDYCMQTGSTRSCHFCDALDLELNHNATYLTDFHTDEEPTWWQSQSMFYGVQYPNSVNITLHLGKAFEITYVRLKFYTSRPESFAIYKRTEENGTWQPYQYYSASCHKMYGRDNKGFIRPGENERTALCTDEFSDISPLTGGNVAFSTLEGRPSAYNFDQSPVLQDWVTATDILISLDRLNTFGDEFFKDPKVLRSYFYAVSDFSVGGRCKCNGHASDCFTNEEGRLVCACEHNTAGVDCQHCAPFYQDRPWARATADSANQCVRCNCNGLADECVFNAEQYRSTGSGGRCVGCRENTAGPHCERCKENFFRSLPQQTCQNCNCNAVGSVSLQCNAEGVCMCRPGVSGVKCDICKSGFHSLGPSGCRLCECDNRGSVGVCSAEDRRCHCKTNVEGQSCNRCKPGSFNLQLENPDGCKKCFCFGHSLACSSSNQYMAINITSDFLEDVTLMLLSYGRTLSVSFTAELEELLPRSVTVIRLYNYYKLYIFLFTDTSQLSRVSLESAVRTNYDMVSHASWVEECSCPRGFTGQFCEHCAPGFTRETPNGGPLSPCVPCNCNQHGTCHPETGVCDCRDFTTGHYCELCEDGYYGNALTGSPGDCLPCPCPDHTTCAQVPETGDVVCTNCPTGQRGVRCELCEDGFYGNPLGWGDKVQPCVMCECNGNVDPNAVGVCDHMTGRCLKCLGHTTGDHCEKCRSGYYGNALANELKPERKCKPCACNVAGTSGSPDCHPDTGKCVCLSHVTGRDCGQCETGYFNLQPGLGCEMCNCNPIGSSSSACHPITGQCTCRTGVEGLSCDTCRMGFFGFSSRGCRACNCDPMGSTLMQCHDNGTCSCRHGFVGYKCDKCELNYYQNRLTHQCEECPVCYSLIRDQVGLPQFMREREMMMKHEKLSFDVMVAQQIKRFTITCYLTHSRSSFAQIFLVFHNEHEWVVTGAQANKVQLIFLIIKVSSTAVIECFDFSVFKYDYVYTLSLHFFSQVLLMIFFTLLCVQASKLKARLRELETLLSSYDCNRYSRHYRGRQQHRHQHNSLDNHIQKDQVEDYLPNALEDLLAIQGEKSLTFPLPR
uniref:Laminin, gamma 3 n=1 Tax=Cyprinus carpio TaxID=7962 RepID=A0A8C2D0V4_CYPCA